MPPRCSWAISSIPSAAVRGDDPIHLYRVHAADSASGAFRRALADRVDRRKLLIVTHVWMMLAAGALGVLTIADMMTPWLLLGFLFAIGAGYAMMNPALLAVLPELVEPRELKSAMALNSVNMNIARVLGPAIGGLAIVVIGGFAAVLRWQGDRVLGDGPVAGRRGLRHGQVEARNVKGSHPQRIDAGRGLERRALRIHVAASVGDQRPDSSCSLCSRGYLPTACAPHLPGDLEFGGGSESGDTIASIMMAFFGDRRDHRRLSDAEAAAKIRRRTSRFRLHRPLRRWRC